MNSLFIVRTSALILFHDYVVVLGATFLFVNLVFHAHSKHVEMDYHFVCDRVAKQEIQVRFIFSKDQLADVLIKPLPSVLYVNFWSKL
jgi:hypothetical protein